MNDRAHMVHTLAQLVRDTLPLTGTKSTGVDPRLASEVVVSSMRRIQQLVIGTLPSATGGLPTVDFTDDSEPFAPDKTHIGQRRR